MSDSRFARAARRPSSRATIVVESARATRNLVVALSAVLCAFAASASAVAQEPSPRDLIELSLEELGEVEVISVARRPRRLLDSPASVFVIQREEILRSGARNLPEALRLAPNLLVARIGATQWAISARGFNNAIGNKLLVLVDGRTVYTPLFAGVSWDSVDVLLEDIERIEVVSGPGSALWGTNAVNGVINILTLPASRTRGWYAGALGATDGHGAAARYGATAGARGDFRIYAKGDRYAASENAAGADLPDEWGFAQAGFRADWALGEDAVSLQGDVYDGESDEERPLGALEASGANLLARWKRTFAGGSGLRVQAYFDRSERVDRVLFDDRLDIFDVEMQHSLEIGRHAIVWGSGYRRASDETEAGLFFLFDPADRDLDFWNVYAQDEISIGEDFRLSAGLRVEHNDYTGTETLPSLRGAWRLGDDLLLWAAASRAVRAPSRVDREFFLPGNPPFLILGGPEFESEVADVYELGFRAEPADGASYSVTLFHHEWDRLRSGQPVPGGFEVQNGLEGSTTGVEAWGTVRLGSRVHLSGGVLALDQDIRREPGSLDPTGPSALGNDPDFQLSGRAAIELLPQLDLDLHVRYVDELPEPPVDAYTAADVTLTWDVRADLAISAIVRNAFDSGHSEFQGSALTQPSRFEPTYGLRLRWLH